VQWIFFARRTQQRKWSIHRRAANWEQQGFGTYNYYKIFKNPDEQGLYKHAFNVAPQYKNKGSLSFRCCHDRRGSDINGRPAGPMHQGGFYQFKYDITGLLQFDRPNLLEVP